VEERNKGTPARYCRSEGSSLSYVMREI